MVVRGNIKQWNQLLAQAAHNAGVITDEEFAFFQNSGYKMPDFRIDYKSDWKYFRSPNYNYSFNLKDGTFARWGTAVKDDPEFSPFGPEILDFEISEVCAGFCPYCYKDNKPEGKNTSFEIFKSVVEKINPNKTLTQVAFGLGMTGMENPELPKMCEWLRNNNIIPNGTVANITKETGKWLAVVQESVRLQNSHRL